MRVVFVTDELPRLGLSGHQAMNHAVVSWLRGLGHEVMILLVGARLGWPVERFALAPVAGPEVVGLRGFVLAGTAPALAGIVARRLLRLAPARAAAWLRRRARAKNFGGADAVLGSFITAAQAGWCGRAIAQARPDAVLVDTLFRAAALPGPAVSGAGPRRVIFAVDVFHRRHRSLAEGGYRVHPAVLPAALEADLLNLGDAIVAIQPEEAAVLQALCPERLVVTAPMPALPCPRPDGVARRAGRLVFVGSATLPNIDGLQWFLAEIWPVLRRADPGLSLDIAGDCGAQLRQVPAGVNRLGRVGDLAGVLHRAALAISPLRVGSGLKIKLLDYARHGLTTVATPISLAGFAADAAAPFVAAGVDAGFATAILGQLAAPPDDGRALAYVERHYGTAASFAGLAAVLGARAAD